MSEDIAEYLERRVGFEETVESGDSDYIPNYAEFSNATVFLHVQLNDGDAGVTVLTANNGSYLMWTDGINEWIEHYPSLTYSLGRLTLLQACAETDWEKGFKQNPRQFVTEFSKFLDVAV